MIAPDETTLRWIEGRPFAQKGELLEQAAEDWRRLPSDADAEFDREIALEPGGSPRS